MGVSLDTQLARNSSLYAHHAERHFLNYCPVTWLVSWNLHVSSDPLHATSNAPSLKAKSPDNNLGNAFLHGSFLDGSSPQASSRIDQYGVVVV
jgi:hypothetical protein